MVLERQQKKYKHWHFRNCFALVPSCWDCCAPSLILLLFCTCALSLIWFESETTPTRVALSGLVLSPLKGSFHLSGGKNKAVFFSFLFHITFFWFDLELNFEEHPSFLKIAIYLFTHNNMFTNFYRIVHSLQLLQFSEPDLNL